MIERLKSLFATRGQGSVAAAPRDDDARGATATLMFIAALMDDSIAETERRAITEAVRLRFGLNAQETAGLLAEAEEAAHDSTHFQRFTAEIKTAFDDGQRAEVMELLWRVVCADGVVHDREANLMRRIAGLLYVTDKDSGLARRRALASLDAAAS